MRDDGLHFDVAPPRIVPLSFFWTAPAALVVAGLLLMGLGSAALESPWSPTTIGLTHLGTLGFLTVSMFGILIQAVPVIGGERLPWPGSVRWAHGLLVVAIAGLSGGTLAGSPMAVFLAIGLLTPVLLTLLIPIGIATRRLPTGATRSGVLTALGAFLVAAFLGIWIAHGHGGMRFPGPRDLWLTVHLEVAILGWVGGLTTAAAWQLLPAWLGRAPASAAAARSHTQLIAIGVALPVAVLLLDAFGLWQPWLGEPAYVAALAAAPAAVAVWGLQPALLLAEMKQAPSSLARFQRAGLALAPIAAAAAVLALLSGETRWGLLFGWVAVVGWAGLLVHGGLRTSIARLLDPEPRPVQAGAASMGLGLHLAALGLGAIGISAGSDLFVRAAGVALVAVAAGLARLLWGRTKPG